MLVDWDPTKLETGQFDDFRELNFNTILIASYTYTHPYAHTPT